MTELSIVYKKIEEIIPYERNNKKHPKKQIDKLAKQISEMKFDVPIVIDEHNVIIKGMGRRLAAIQLKMDKVPCIIRTDLTGAQKKAARIADNKLSDMGKIDLDNLKFEMEELKSIDFSVDLTGFSDYSMLNVFANKEESDEKKDNQVGGFDVFDTRCPSCGHFFNQKAKEEIKENSDGQD